MLLALFAQPNAPVAGEYMTTTHLLPVLTGGWEVTVVCVVVRVLLVVVTSDVVELVAVLDLLWSDPLISNSAVTAPPSRRMVAATAPMMIGTLLRFGG